jgi:hypothetical protein
MENRNNIELEIAKERVRKIKGFYKHLIAFVIINIFILYLNIKNLAPEESFFQVKVFSTFLFWGIGLLAHAGSIFVPNWIFGENWEKRKIEELTKKYNQK